MDMGMDIDKLSAHEYSLEKEVSFACPIISAEVNQF